MTQVHRLSEHRREFITDGERSELRATWHAESGHVVISLWRGERCVATSHLTPRESGRLATFITGGLADAAQLGMTREIATATPKQQAWRESLRTGIATWRTSVARSLERIARRLHRA